MTTENQDDRELRSFAHVLTALDEGSVHGDASEELTRVVLALARHADSFGKAKGSVTLTLNITAERGGSVDVAADIKSKVPRNVRAKSVLWVSKGGHLTGSNPRQLELGAGPRAVPPRPIRGESEKH